MISNLKSRILVVDPNEMDQAVLRQLLEEENYESEFVTTAEQALRSIKKKHYELIISELVLGKKSGLDLLKEVRANNPTIPFIINTSHHCSAEISIEAINLGVTSYMLKPIDVKITREVIKRAVRHQKSRYLKIKQIDYQMENTFYAVVSSSEQSIIKLLETVDNLIDLVYPSGVGGFPDLKMAIYEALSNALEHGNKGENEKNIYFTIDLKMDRIIVHIKDEGEGFEYSSDLLDDEASIENRHGIKMIEYLMDETTFNMKGNEISMLKLI